MKLILDPCCGSRMMWFDREDPRAEFGDIRSEMVTVTDRSHREDGTRTLTIAPDQIMDFRALPHPNGTFKLVVFDPPHLERAGPRSWLRAKYGALDADTWRDDLRAGFAECFRVLESSGVLIFKWNETQIPVREILTLTDEKPLFGHQSGKRSATHWICFMKGASHAD
ncbi:TRM11 family methyltransferase [Burkholderia cepacia]|uniref:class I SAM-dependent methyltransferase n=1 Tax=Burkholderia cepacia TaxID=292 RepID=UPI001CF5D00A|nr:class I SAM-dependent methyltransferase [Burkholderia cepacia]MCA8075350.1 class I SAM-dependent methyltransferase [Burkholderia cepacia]